MATHCEPRLWQPPTYGHLAHLVWEKNGRRYILPCVRHGLVGVFHFVMRNVDIGLKKPYETATLGCGGVFIHPELTLVH